MTTIHLVRGLYLIVSGAVFITAAWTSRAVTGRDVYARFAFAAYALAITASQVYAFNLRLTIGTAYIGFGVAGGAVWLGALLLDRRKVRR